LRGGGHGVQDVVKTGKSGVAADRQRGQSGSGCRGREF
jgi:hypothetical protein